MNNMFCGTARDFAEKVSRRLEAENRIPDENWEGVCFTWDNDQPRYLIRILRDPCMEECLSFLICADGSEEAYHFPYNIYNPFKSELHESIRKFMEMSGIGKEAILKEVEADKNIPWFSYCYYKQDITDALDRLFVDDEVDNIFTAKQYLHGKLHNIVKQDVIAVLKRKFFNDPDGMKEKAEVYSLYKLAKWDFSELSPKDFEGFRNDEDLEQYAEYQFGFVHLGELGIEISTSYGNMYGTLCIGGSGDHLSKIKKKDGTPYTYEILDDKPIQIGSSEYMKDLSYTQFLYEIVIDILHYLVRFDDKEKKDALIAKAASDVVFF